MKAHKNNIKITLAIIFLMISTLFFAFDIVSAKTDSEKLDDILFKMDKYDQFYNRGSVTVHGTEYTYGQTAKVWLQLLNATGSNVDNGICYADIYTPLGGYLIEGATMTNMVHDGIYYYDFQVPIRQGVYPAIAKCYFTASQNPRLAQSYSLLTGAVVSGTISDTWTLNNVGLIIKTAGGGGNNRLNITMNFSDYFANCGNISESFLTGTTVYWNGNWNTGTTNHDVILYIYNYTSSSWITFSNKILGGLGATTQTVSNSLSMNNVTKSIGVNASNPLTIRLMDTANTEGAKNLMNDYVYASCDALANPQWQEVKGSSEVHVTNPDFFTITTDDDVYEINTTQSVTVVNGTTVTETYYTGIFKNQFEVSSGSLASKNVTIEYQGLHSIPCNAITDLYYINATGYYAVPYTTQRQTTEDHCSVNFPLMLEVGGIYNFEVHARNIWESDMRSTNAGFGSIYPLLDEGCTLWRIVKGYPSYNIPKNETVEQYDYYYRACSDMYDDYYWFNKTYQQSLIDKPLIMDEQTYLQYEADYTSVKFAEDKLNVVVNYLLNNLQAVNDYSKLLIDNPLGDNVVNTTNQRYWANQSTLYQAWRIVNASCGTGTCLVNNSIVASDIWNAPSRNLTYYQNFGDQTNYSRISNLTASDVWSYSNRALSNSTIIAEAVWNYTGVPVSSLLNSIADAVWNYVGRYIHGTISS